MRMKLMKRNTTLRFISIIQLWNMDRTLISQRLTKILPVCPRLLLLTDNWSPTNGMTLTSWLHFFKISQMMTDTSSISSLVMLETHMIFNPWLNRTTQVRVRWQVLSQRKHQVLRRLRSSLLSLRKASRPISMMSLLSTSLLQIGLLRGTSTNKLVTRSSSNSSEDGKLLECGEGTSSRKREKRSRTTLLRSYLC